MNEIKAIEAVQIAAQSEKKGQSDEFHVGDTVKVHFRIIEGNKERIQVYEGLVIAIKNAGIGRTFTVRKNSYGVGVERVFPLYSPRVTRVEVTRRGKVRRAKLYYIRTKIGKAAKIKEKLIKKSVAKSASHTSSAADSK